MNKYVCIYDEEYVMNHCIKTEAKNIDEAKDKFVEYLKTEHNIIFVRMNRVYIVNYSCLGEI